jgi:GntR family transcriptional repressor for pyruvate dehydrogenase complex
MPAHHYNRVGHVRAYQEIVDQISQKIIENEIQPGEQLPSERELAELFGVSRVAVREATKTLSTMGLIEIKQGVGTFVSLHPDKLISRSFSISLAMEKGSLFQLLELRRALETTTAMFAAERATDDDLEKMARYLNKMKSAVDRQSIEDTHAADFEFHLAIAQATHNPFLIAMAEPTITLVKDGLRGIVGIVGPFERYRSEHESIYAAIRNRNPQQAFARMGEHIDETCKIIKELTQ